MQRKSQYGLSSVDSGHGSRGTGAFEFRVLGKPGDVGEWISASNRLMLPPAIGPLVSGNPVLDGVGIMPPGSAVFRVGATVGTVE